MSTQHRSMGWVEWILQGSITGLQKLPALSALILITLNILCTHKCLSNLSCGAHHHKGNTSQNNPSQESRFHTQMLSLTATPGAPELCGLLPFNVLRLNICLERCEYFYFVALAVGVDLCCHLIREQVKLAPG